MLVLPIKIKQEKQKLAATSTPSNITATFAHSLFTRSKAKRHEWWKHFVNIQSVVNVLHSKACLLDKTLAGVDQWQQMIFHKVDRSPTSTSKSTKLCHKVNNSFFTVTLLLRHYSQRILKTLNWWQLQKKTQGLMLAAPLTVADWRRWAATTVCERQAAHSAHSNLSTEKISTNSTIFGFCCQSTSINLKSTDWALPIHSHWYFFKTSATKLDMQPFSSTCFSWTPNSWHLPACQRCFHECSHQIIAEHWRCKYQCIRSGIAWEKLQRETFCWSGWVLLTE